MSKKNLEALPFSLEMEEISINGYERVLRVEEKRVNLSAIISLHNLTLGPALGGIRIQPYKSFEAALEDALRLSQGMTYKSSVAGVGFGGGKSVIIADPKTQKTPELLLAFGTAVHALEGAYICAEDVGCSMADVDIIRRATPYVVGLSHERASGNPSPFTAWGVFRGIQSVAFKLFGSESLTGKTIAIQGLGSVGSCLADLLFWTGANLIIADVDREKTDLLAQRYGAKSVGADQIIQEKCDIFAPCALGGILNEQTIPTLRCQGIAGAANNQLLQETDGDTLAKKKILYAPDFVINAGGLLNVSAELEEGGYHPENPRKKTHQIYDTLLEIYAIAEKNRTSTQSAALELATHRLEHGIGKRIFSPTFHNAITD